jgi:hypothetical protein
VTVAWCQVCGKKPGEPLTAEDREQLRYDLAPWIRALCPRCRERQRPTEKMLARRREQARRAEIRRGVGQ